MPQQAVKARRPALAVVSKGSDPDHPSWMDAVEVFLRHKRGENLAPSSLENYRWHLDGPRARQFREDHDINEPADLTAEALNRLQQELLDAGLSSSMAHAHHRVWKNFGRFCRERGWGVEEALLKVKPPIREQREPSTISPAEERRLMAAAHSPRDKMLVEFMLRTGLRLSEVANTTIADIQDSPYGYFVRVRQGKGRKDRSVPLDTGTTNFSAKLQRYISRDRPKSEDGHLFLTERKGGGGGYVPLTARGIQIRMYRLGQEAGVRANPHSFRHTFATRALQSGVDMVQLQKALGHTTLAMVVRYVHYGNEDVLKAWKRIKD